VDGGRQLGSPPWAEVGYSEEEIARLRAGVAGTVATTVPARPRWVGAMQAKSLLDEASTSFGPEALTVIGRAFDEAWSEIAGRFKDGAKIEAARFWLAQTILTAASDSSRCCVAQARRSGGPEVPQ
jgi:hypothetical protein